MSQLWHAFEKLDDVTTSLLSWRLLLGDDFEANRDLLMATDKLAAAVPVPGRPYEWLQVREIEDGVYEGYNEKTESFCPIDRREIVCYEFNFGKLARDLGELVGFDVAFEKLGGPHYRYRFGRYGNPNGASFAFYMAKVSDPRRLNWCVDAFLAENRRPFVLFLTSKRVLSSQNETSLDARGCLVVPLEEALARDQEGLWGLSSWARDQIVAFRDRMMPPANATVGHFPTPPGSRWQDVEIRFLCDQRVAVTVRGQHQILTYTQLGLVDSRSGRPSKQWALLQSFADEHGTLTWLSPAACRKNRKRRELLSHTLQRFFNIDGEPIELTEDRKGWSCVFKLHAWGEGNYPTFSK
jgi:hypothetical protein